MRIGQGGTLLMMGARCMKQDFWFGYIKNRHSYAQQTGTRMHETGTYMPSNQVRLEGILLMFSKRSAKNSRTI